MHGLRAVPITSIPASAEGSGSIQVNKSSKTEDDNIETFLPSTVEVDLAGVGEQILFEMIGFEDADISNCSLITDYIGFDEFDEIEAPDI